MTQKSRSRSLRGTCGLKTKIRSHLITDLLNNLLCWRKTNFLSCFFVSNSLADILCFSCVFPPSFVLIRSSLAAAYMILVAQFKSLVDILCFSCMCRGPYMHVSTERQRYVFDFTRTNHPDGTCAWACVVVWYGACIARETGWGPMAVRVRADSAQWITILRYWTGNISLG